MKVYGHPLSTCTRKVLCALAEKGAEAEFVLVDLMKGEHKQPAHLARQPFGVVPALEDGDFTMYESRAIIRYLDRAVPGASLTPEGARGAGEMEQWMSVEGSYFTPAAMKVLYQSLFAPMYGRTPDEAQIAEGQVALGRVLDVMERHLTGREYLAGAGAGSFSLADICYLPYIEYLVATGQAQGLTSRPAVAAWWARCSGRPSWQKATGKA